MIETFNKYKKIDEIYKFIYIFYVLPISYTSNRFKKRLKKGQVNALLVEKSYCIKLYLKKT